MEKKQVIMIAVAAVIMIAAIVLLAKYVLGGSSGSSDRPTLSIISNTSVPADQLA